MLAVAFLALFLILWAIVYSSLPALRHSGRVLAHVVARSARINRIVASTRERYSHYLPVALIVIVGALLTAWAGDAFMDLAEQVHANSTTLSRTDARVHDWAVEQRRKDATGFFGAMSVIGGPAGVATILVLAGIALALRRRWNWLVYLAITAFGGALLNLELKHYFARARPAVAEMLRRAHGYSFPSGHAMGSTVAFTALAYLAFRAIPSWPRKAAVVALLYTLIVAVALSRVYLGVHWISDVAGGFTAGTVWVTSTTVAYETLRRIRRLRGLRREGLGARP